MAEKPYYDVKIQWFFFKKQIEQILTLEQTAHKPLKKPWKIQFSNFVTFWVMGEKLYYYDVIYLKFDIAGVLVVRSAPYLAQR